MLRTGRSPEDDVTLVGPIKYRFVKERTFDIGFHGILGRVRLNRGGWGRDIPDKGELSYVVMLSPYRAYLEAHQVNVFIWNGALD